jgi:hypothetical protein
VSPPRRRIELRGVIASAGFAAGHRLVVGHWLDSPIGAFTDVMWAQPDGTRVLLAPSPEALALITGVYGFDRTVVVDVQAEHHADRRAARLAVVAGPVELVLEGGRPVPVPLSRWAPFTRWVQGPVARAALGVRTYGVTPTGVEEWYRASSVRWVRAGVARVDGVDAGPWGPVRPPVRFGVSEPPARPSIVAISPLLRYPAVGAATAR